MREEFSKIFSGNNNPIYLANAPGRMDVMGGIADYSGSLVLQMPIREHTTVALALRNDDRVRIKTLSGEVGPDFFEIEYGELLKKGKVDYAFAREKLNGLPGGDWAAYVVGCLLVLEKEKSLTGNKGMDCLIDSHVPAGKGVSSSAALETATMKALQQACDINFTGTELPILAQKVENLVVGAPCGLMDQLSSYFGETGHLLPILCQPDIISNLIPIPRGVYFVGIDSGVRHAVGGASYGEVRTAAFMGYGIIAQREGITAEKIGEARQSGNWSSLPYKGYLTNISVLDFEKKYLDLLPEKISGQSFLDQFGSTIDSVTEINPGINYSVKQATSHPVYENERVAKFAKILESMPQEADEFESSLVSLGELMNGSHRSYGDCGLGSDATDRLAMAVSRNKGIYGARITGGGSGGTVCMICKGAAGLETAREIHRQYQKERGITTVLFQ
jgi:L-arabinokinase